MRLRKVYTRIFLSFLLVLVVTEVLVFALFRFYAGRSFRYRFERFVSAQAVLAKELIEGSIASNPQTSLPQNLALKDLIMRIGETHGAMVWLEDSDGETVVKSFEGMVPQQRSRARTRRAQDFGHFKVYHDFRSPYGAHVSIPLRIRNDETGSLHILFEKTDRDTHQGGFLLGLVGIGIVIAFLVIPVSRAITGRVKQLRNSALRIAEGNLSDRVRVKGRDEIAELGRSFNRMADKLERMIQGNRELTANVSHELRSPLARIRVAMELLSEKLEQADNEGCRKSLADIGEDIEELDHLIGRILYLSKLDIHESPLKPELIDLSELMEELLERVRHTLDRRNVQVKTDFTFRPPFIGDWEALRTALGNILDNTTKFTPEGGEVLVEMHPNQNYLLLRITNTFKVLSEADLASIFKPFYRAGQTPAAGSGLGLAIAKRIIEKHGGAIEALNSPAGLTIRISLPREPGDDVIRHEMSQP